MKKLLVGVICLLAALFGLWEFSKSETIQFYGGLVAQVDTADKVVALTFDDGPTAGFTDTVLEMLSEADIKATFFLVGKAIERNPQAARKIIAHGHEVGNHSYSHKTMIGKKPSFIAAEIEQTNRLITQAGYHEAIHFRPPYGKKLVVLPRYLNKKGIKTITWDVAPEKYLPAGAGPKAISEYIETHAKPGSIILLHVMFKSRANSLAAVPGTISALKAKGYRFVTVSELISAF